HALMAAVIVLAAPAASAATRADAMPSDAGPIPSSLLHVTVNNRDVDAAANLPDTYDISTGWTYVDCCPTGSPEDKFFSHGWSIATWITAAGAAPNHTQSVTITLPETGASEPLLPRDFDPTQPGGLDFPQSACEPPSHGPTWSCPAFVYTDGAGAGQTLRFF